MKAWRTMDASAGPTTIDGYVNDIPYMDNVWTDHAPGHLRFKALAHGVGAPDASRFTYLALGCGTGIGTTLYAGLHPEAHFVGIDASEAHIVQAEAFAKETGIANVRFIRATFQEMLASPPADLPLFDYVIVHGVYSWIDEANREVLRRLLRKVCASGAIVFISYNALPGNGAMLPFQRLVRHAGTLVGGSSEERVARAQEVVGRWIERGDAFFRQNEAMRSQRDRMMERSLSYQAHELLNGSWIPFHVTDVAGQMAQHDFGFVGSAMDVMPPLADTTLDCVPEAAARLWNELARDYTRNTLFRADLYQAPARNPFDAARPGRIEDEWLGSLTGLAQLLASLPVAFRNPDVDAVAERWWTMMRNGPVTVGDMLEEGQELGADARLLLWFLIDTRDFIPARPAPAGIDAARRINLALLREPPFGRRVKAMAVPLTGASFTITQSVALSWLVELAHPGLAVMDHAREMQRLLDLRGESLAGTYEDDIARETALFGHALTHIRKGRDRMRFAGLI
jgi:SAM-dependent methyltransferase